MGSGHSGKDGTTQDVSPYLSLGCCAELRAARSRQKSSTVSWLLMSVPAVVPPVVGMMSLQGFYKEGRPIA